MRALSAGTIALVALGVTPEALADDATDVVTVGVMVSAPLTGNLSQWGLGVATSLTHYPDDDRFLGVGGFLQAEYLLGGGWRVGLGVQPVAWAVGGELGLAVVAPPDRALTVALHLAPYLSIGYATASARYTAPLVGEARGLGLTLAGNLWFRLRQGVARRPYELWMFEEMSATP